MRHLLTILPFFLLLLTACEAGDSRKPRGNASPYGVLVVNDSAGVVGRQLSQDEPGLPQPEPQFDCSAIKRKDFRGSKRRARAIVIFEPSGIPGATDLSWKLNVDAHPQIVIKTTAGGLQRLQPLLDAFERNVAAQEIKRKGNRHFENLIDSLFQFRMLVPADMTASKRGRDFLWMSNNSLRGMQNLCVMRLQGTTTTDRIDSCLKANIKGETDRMWMQLVKSTVHKRQIGNAQGFYGLWQMEGDAMGGPFTARVFDRADGSSVVVMGFVYAPEMKKRNLIQQLNAVLYNKYINNGK